MHRQFALRHLYFGLFAISGFSGLIYESIWTHYLKLFLGHAAYAQTLVLVIFMGGMAIGSWLASRHGAKLPNLLLSYAIVEGIIGLLAIAFHPIFTHATDFAYLFVIPQLSSAEAVTAFKWTLAALLILPQSILLGMTFPLMSAGIIRRFPSTPGHSIAILYFANSLGAAIGVLVSGFILIEAIGLPGTILSGGLINLVLALVVWGLCRSDGDLRQSETPLTRSTAKPASALLIAFLLCAALTGAASFMYEIAWIRMLSLVLGSSTHAFELMLSAFILGLALGGYWIKNRIDQLSSPIMALGLAQVIMGLLALSTLVIYGQTFDFMSYLMKALSRNEQGYILFNLSSHLLAMLVMVPTTFCAGMTLPLLTYQLLAKGHGEKAIGGIYAANTFGSIVGVIVAVQLVMPELGVKNVIVIGSGIDILLGILLLYFAGSAMPKWVWAGVSAVAIAAISSSVLWVELDSVKMASGVFRTGEVDVNREMIFAKDGKTASIALSSFDHGEVVILTSNGKPDAGARPSRKLSLENPSDEPTMTLLAAIPYALHPEVKTAAVIGFGSGMTTHTLLTVPSIKQVDTVEIEPAVVEASRGFGSLVKRAYEDPRSHIHIEDAKAYFTSENKQYDLIISEPSNPWVSGVAGLFSKEFYHLIRNHVTEDGLFVQWMHLYELDMPLVASVLKALSQNFEDYRIYFATEPDIIIVGKKRGKLGQLSPALFDSPELKTRLGEMGVFSLADLELRLTGDKYLLDPLFNTYPTKANSDYFPTLDLGAVRTRFMQSSAADLHNPINIALPLVETLQQQTPRLTPLMVSSNPLNFRGDVAYQASLIYNYFQALASGQTPVGGGIDEVTLKTLRGMRQIESQCYPNELEKAWLPYLHMLMKMTIPYLNQQEMEAIWQDLDKSPCLNQLTDTVKNWVNLYKSASRRDFALMAEFSLALLPAEGQIAAHRDQNDYLMTAAVLAHIVLQQKSTIHNLWRRYSDMMNPPVELRLLIALNYQRP
jgi:spermidine synthase